MPTTLASRTLGPAGTPHSVKELRQSSFDLHEQLGFPVIHKHRWNEQDLREGLVDRCPLHDDIYDRDLSWDNVCFGTGYVGGFGDPSIVFVTLQDAPQQTVKIGPQGALMLDQHPQLTAPWLPFMGDGDLVILADFTPGTWDVLDTHERYELREVRPITIRGPEFRTSSTTLKRLRISQEASVDRLPYGHPFYDVPIVYDPGNVPPDPNPDDPDAPVDFTGTYTEASWAVRLLGVAPPKTADRAQDVRVAVLSDNAQATWGVRIVGKEKGTHVHID
jgi:hypothetical protein